MNRIRTIRVALSIILAIILTFAFSVGEGYVSAWLVTLQFGPALLAGIAGKLLASAAVVIGILIATGLFGRAYCAVLCPLGTIQECISFFSRSRSQVPNLKSFRYGIAGLSLLLLIGGWAVGFKLFEPFSRAGSIIAAVRHVTVSLYGGNPVLFLSVASGAATLLLIVMIVSWKRRLYCSGICPVGTILGLVSRFSLHRIRFTDSCKGCGECARACPVGCVDVEQRRVDAERCILCLNCLAVCPANGLTYGRRKRYITAGNAAISPSRRAFLGKSAFIAAGFVFAHYGLRKILASHVAASEFLASRIFPPGAGDPDRFASLCTGCHLCVARCPTGIIKPALAGAGPVCLDYSFGKCDYDCTACNAACPTGALKPLTLLEKQYTRIGRGEVALQNCLVVTDNKPCDRCAQACPVRTIFMVDGPNGIPVPEVNAFHCIGCGACQSVCPAESCAITVVSTGRQELME